MPHESTVITTIAGALVLAFALGFVASKLRLPPIVGYLVAGVAIGPFTPGFVGDATLAAQLAEIGVILLMFGVGLHFSPSDLVQAKGVALPGALAQMTVAAAIGAFVGHAWGWSWAGSIIFGLSLSVASTVVVLRTLEPRGLLDSADGRLAVGWLVVEDLALVLALVLIPALVPQPGVAQPALGAALLVTIGKLVGFVAVMVVIGRRVIPWMLTAVARTGSRELFTLAVLAVALGIALGAAQLFGVSFALGAFVAGIVVGESDVSHQAAADALPLQDAFAVIFFVSVGMLVDPRVFVDHWPRIGVVLLVILFGQTITAALFAVALGRPLRSALTLGASVGQVGEFSFILAALGVSLGALPTEGRDLVLAGALVSITLNPLLFAAIDPVERRLMASRRVAAFFDRLARRGPAADDTPHSDLHHGHVIIVGFGRVGGTIGDVLAGEGVPFVVIERDRATVERARSKGYDAIFGDAARPGLLEHASVTTARMLVVSIPDPLHARVVIERARKLNADILTVARTHSEEEYAALTRLGVGRAFLGERELAFGMARYTLRAVRT